MLPVRVVWIVLLLTLLATCVPAQEATPPPDQIAQIQPPPQLPQPTRPILRPRVLDLPRLAVPLLQLPDLTASITGPNRVVAGASVNLNVTVNNRGRGTAPGITGNPSGYQVDLVFSQDADVPLEWATQPTYTGYTRDDFVEDMLMLGGRISNTQNVAAGASVSYSISVPIPRKTAPGVYCIAAVVDPGKSVFEFNEGNNIYCHRVLVAAAPDAGVRPPPGIPVWVMPWGVGGIRVDSIKPTGLVDYAGIANAPFGWRLGLRHGYQDSIPNANIKYYRWLYRPQGAGAWTELTESVGAHYVKQEGTTTTFPVYALGPQGIGGKNLYEFRPHVPPSFPGATTNWPATDWFGDIYSGFFDTRTLPDGRYQLKLEVYNPAGVQVMPGPAFRFIVPSGTLPDGTITTTAAAPASIDAGGYVFLLHVNNRQCGASIDPPTLGGSSLTGPCGFLIYDPAVAETDNAAKIGLGFHATQPGNFASFRFNVVRGATTTISSSAVVSVINAPPFTGDGNGNYSATFTRSQLLGPDCPVQGAFSLNLYVYAKATDGWSRLHMYDASAVRAFALAPE